MVVFAGVVASDIRRDDNFVVCTVGITGPFVNKLEVINAPQKLDIALPVLSYFMIHGQRIVVQMCVTLPDRDVCLVR